MGLFKRKPVLKKGDIKISSDDLVALFSLIDKYQDIIFNNLDILDDDERVDVDCSIDLYNKLNVKYILLSDLRRREHLWYEILSLIDKGKYPKGLEVDLKDDNCSLKDYMLAIENLIDDMQELTQNISVLIGQLIGVFGCENVRRSVLEFYLELKTERENIKS